MTWTTAGGPRRGEDVCTLAELVACVVVEFRWSRKEAWQRVKHVTETRGFRQVMCKIERPGGQQSFVTRSLKAIGDPDKIQVVKSDALRVLREEFPRTVGSKRGPKSKYDWSKSYSALKQHWKMTGNIPEKQADDENFVKDCFAKTDEYPTERIIRDKVEGWRREATRGQ